MDIAAQREVIATDDRRIDALRRADTATLDKIYQYDYTLVTPTGAIRSKADQLRELASGQFRYETLEVTERTVRVYGDVAVLVEREKTRIVNAGRPLGGDTRFTRVYRRFGTEWRVIATQGSFIRP
jgi:ketosteroid isomerase-like protein